MTAEVIPLWVRCSTVLALLQALKISPHDRAAPCWIPHTISDVIPVRGVRGDCDHRMMRRASTQRTGAGIKDPILGRDEFRVTLLSSLIFVVADVVCP